MRNAVIIGRKTASSNRRAGMVDSIIGAHAQNCQHTGKNNRKQQIDIKQCYGSCTDTRQNTAVGKAADLRIKKIHSTTGNLRQQCYEQHDDADTANPVRQRAPKQQAARYYVKIGNCCCAGSGQSGHTFKVSSGRIQNAVKAIWQRTQGSSQKPRKEYRADTLAHG